MGNRGNNIKDNTDIVVTKTATEIVEYIDAINIDLTNKDAFALAMYKIGKRYRVDTADIESIDNRFELYIELCVTHGQIATEVQFATFCGVNRSVFWDWINGRTRSSSPSHNDTVQKWKQFFEGGLTQEALTAKNPAGSIFLLKNNHGYTDKQEIEVNANNSSLSDKTVEEIATEYTTQAIEQKPDTDF
jgi:hypothetical protein